MEMPDQRTNLCFIGMQQSELYVHTTTKIADLVKNMKYYETDFLIIPNIPKPEDTPEIGVDEATKNWCMNLGKGSRSICRTEEPSKGNIKIESGVDAQIK